MQYAQSLPAGTFGHAYGEFMRRRSFLASDRPPVRFIDDEELAYVAQRSREVHDLWHVLFNCKTTVLGELALKAVEFVQARLLPHPPSCPHIRTPRMPIPSLENSCPRWWWCVHSELFMMQANSNQLMCADGNAHDSVVSNGSILAA